jgi:hypothetical protein
MFKLAALGALASVEALSTDQPSLIAPAGAVATTTTSDKTTLGGGGMMGGWTDKAEVTDAQKLMILAWKKPVFKFLNMKEFENFEPLYISKQIVNGTNYKVVVDVSKSAEDKKVIIVTVHVPLPSKDKTAALPSIMSVRLPSGVLHKGGDMTEDGEGKLGGKSKWKADIDASYKKKFKAFQKIIQKFHGNKNYGTNFTPIRY